MEDTLPEAKNQRRQDLIWDEQLAITTINLLSNFVVYFSFPEKKCHFVS